MFNSLNNILEGWANNIKNNFGLLSPELKSKGEKRLLICNVCTLRDGNTCSKKRTGLVVQDFVYKDIERLKGQEVNGCGCMLSMKSLCDNCQCPRGLWQK